ncbi:MAG: IclR family transcriptional regulator [Deltaproteobacteria bacterium]|nr:IclR family transcriptional regulator [Deltaproteobacteria bacterium]
MGKGYFAPSVKRVFEILRAISSCKDGLGISELARDLNMAKSTVHGMTSALEKEGAIVRDPLSKRYTLGVTLFELGRSAYSQVDLQAAARPVMETLMERTLTSVFLGVQNGERVTILDVVESSSELKITSPVGTTLPLVAGAVGKVLLSRMDGDQALKLITKMGITRYTASTPVEPDAYLREIALVRQRGYATDDEEYILGVRAVACPVMEESHLMAVLWAVGFKAGLDGDRMKRLISETLHAAEAINQRIRGKRSMPEKGSLSVGARAKDS